MGFLSGFSTGEVKAFANELADSLTRDLPPKLMLKSSNVISANRVTTILERCYSKAATFQASHEIGFVQRAAFANEFKWRMSDLGYPKELISVATEGLLVHLAKSKRSVKA